MAGPDLKVLTENQISKDQEAMILDYVGCIADSVEENNFWVAGQPFFVLFEHADEEEVCLSLNGWNPKGVVIFGAMCNSQASHVLLATIAIKIARMTQGFIILERITKLTESAVVLSLEGHIKLNSYDYAVSPGFMCYWVGEPEFRLLK